MKPNFKKIAKAMAIGVFFLALFLNIKVSLENPFIRVDNAALAQTSSNSPICCQYTGAFCTDKLGNAHSDSIQRPGPYCS